MAYHATITKEQIRQNLKERINADRAQLDALKRVKIDTSHKVLTNRAISGEGAVLRNAPYSMHDKNDKELSISYVVKTGENGLKYENRTITARVFTGETTGILKDIRLMTPAELNDQLTDVKDSLANNIADFRDEYRRADSIAKKHNALVEKIEEFNDGLSYASKAQI